MRRNSERNHFWDAGRSAGLRAGWERGWKEGACEAAAAAVTTPQPPVSDLKVLYIPQGFEAIDEGIIHALRCRVREVHTAGAETMSESAAAIQPDLMLVLNGLHVFPENHLLQVDAVRSLGIRTAIWFADDPYVTDDTVLIAPHYDIVFTHELGTADLYRSLGCEEVYVLPFGAHPGTFKPLRAEKEYWSDVCFIGQAFWNRVELFDAIAPSLFGRKVFIAGGLWDRLNRFELLQSSIRMGWLPVKESVNYYSGAKIVINVHRTTEAGSDNHNSRGIPGRSVNPRTFEIAACGAFQLTDRREDLEQYYTVGKELDVYEDAEDLADKISYYLDRPAERSHMAVRGMIRTLREHDYIARIGRMLELLGLS